MKGIVFDFGGVMTTSTMPQRVMAKCEELKIDFELIRKGFLNYRLQYDGGFITLKEMYEKIFADNKIELTEEQFAAILEADRASWLYRNEKTLEWMKSLKEKGYKLGILTNMAPDFAPLFKEHFADFIALADALVISGEEHMYKPNREIYDLLRSRIALPAEELLFIDDVMGNIFGARKAGWKGIRFISNEQVECDFMHELWK